MKITIHTWAEDTRANGTDSQIFATEKELHDHMESTMGLDPDEKDDKELLEMIEDEGVEAAFLEWTQNGGADYLDTYNFDSQELNFPDLVALPKAAAEAILAYLDANADELKELEQVSAGHQALKAAMIEEGVAQ